MNKKAIIISIITVLIIIGTIFVVNIINTNKFKKEYESLNGKKAENGQPYLKLTIDKENPIVYSNYKEIFDILDGTGIIYFGFPECPWCRNAVPVLLDAAEEVGIEKIYYMNNLEDRDVKELKDGKIVTTKKGTSNYYKLLEKLKDKASIYKGLNDDSIKRLYYPTVIAVKNGEIIDTIVGTVDSQIDPYIPMTKKQKRELKGKYMEAIKKIIMCGSVNDTK